MNIGLVGMAIILLLPGVLAGMLGAFTTSLTARFYNITINRSLFDIGVLLGFGMYVYTVVYVVSSSFSGAFLGHVSANLLTTGVLLGFLGDTFNHTVVTPNSFWLRSNPGILLTASGVKGVTVVALIIHSLVF